MSFYDIRLREDRDRLRKERQDEITALETGKWPRDTDDILRWSRTDKKYVKRICLAEIIYLDIIEGRVKYGEIENMSAEAEKEFLNKLNSVLK